MDVKSTLTSNTGKPLPGGTLRSFSKSSGPQALSPQLHPSLAGIIATSVIEGDAVEFGAGGGGGAGGGTATLLCPEKRSPGSAIAAGGATLASLTSLTEPTDS